MEIATPTSITRILLYMSGAYKAHIRGSFRFVSISAKPFEAPSFSQTSFSSALSNQSKHKVTSRIFKGADFQFSS